MSKIKNKIVVITGASSGIGALMAEEIAKEGGAPVLVARRIDRLTQLSRQLEQKYGIKSYCYPLDVSDTSAVEKVFHDITTEVGPIDVLINNAGFALFKNAHEATNEDVKKMFEVNVLGLMACSRAVLPMMIQRNAGQIINVASIIGKIPTPKATAYAATKHAVLGYTNGLRMELDATDIVVTAVNPGPIQTEFFDIADASGTYVKNVQNMMLKPEAVAKKVVAAIGTKRRELNLPWWMGLGGKIYAVAPVILEKTLGKRLFQK